MYSKKNLYYRKLVNILVILFLTFIFAVNGPIIFAQLNVKLPSNPNYSSLHQKLTPAPSRLSAFPASLIPHLDFTPVATIYFPIVLREPPVELTNCNPTGGSGGLPPGSYETTVAGLDALIIVGKDYNPANPTYLSFYIHGNDGGYTWFKSPSNLINKLVNNHNWIFVAPRSPQGTSWSKNWQESLNQAFAQVLDEMFAKYNVCRDTIIGSGASGGAIFWTGFFFPYEGGKYPVHISLLCGGRDAHNSASRQKVIQLGQNPEVVARSTFDFIVGTEDYLYEQTKDTINLYTDAGFNIDQLIIEGAGHCNEWTGAGFPSFFQRIYDDWEDRIKELKLEQ